MISGTVRSFAARRINFSRLNSKAGCEISPAGAACAATAVVAALTGARGHRNSFDAAAERATRFVEVVD